MVGIEDKQIHTAETCLLQYKTWYVCNAPDGFDHYAYIEGAPIDINVKLHRVVFCYGYCLILTSKIVANYGLARTLSAYSVEPSGDMIEILYAIVKTHKTSYQIVRNEKGDLTLIDTTGL